MEAHVSQVSARNYVELQLTRARLRGCAPASAMPSLCFRMIRWFRLTCASEPWRDDFNFTTDERLNPHRPQSSSRNRKSKIEDEDGGTRTSEDE